MQQQKMEQQMWISNDLKQQYKKMHENDKVRIK